MNIVPSPQSIDQRDGFLQLKRRLRLHGGGRAASLLTERLGITAGIIVHEVDSTAEADVVFSSDDSLGAEAYRLEISEHIHILSADSRGAGWAVQTLLQLLPCGIHGPGPVELSTLQLPHVVIEDGPRFPWRGSMLDVARHFMPVAGVLKHLDVMAMHKLNVLHLHLTDDQGWRLPVAAFPRLTDVGGWRPGTVLGHQPPPDENDCDDVAEHDGRPHGGSYTREDIRSIVARADVLGITVVPEIDMPGHMEAAIAAYPWLGACDHVDHPRTCFGVSEHVLALSERTIQFCLTVLDAAMELFPGSPIHVGGDECPSREWMTHAPTRDTMEAVGAVDAQSAQAWFEQRICQHVLDAGRRVIAWDEVLDGGAPKGTTVMVWRDPDAIARAASLGHDVIAAPVDYTYFDYGQLDTANQPLSIGGPTTFEKVTGLHVILDGQDPSVAHRLLGGQFQLWSEYLRTVDRMEYFAWPRGASVAQQLWTGDSEGVASVKDLANHLPRLTAAGVNWCRSDA